MDSENGLSEVAKRYRATGYEVAVKPRGKKVPGFAREFQPDLIAVRGDQNVIVQVKRNLSDLAEDASLPRFAEVTNAQPGWRFDVVILEQESPMERLASESSEPPVKRIEELLTHAEKSSEAADTLSAYLVAWSGLEAAMRYRARAEGIAGSRPAEAVVLIRTLFASGLITAEELRRLDGAHKKRSQLAHGFEGAKVGRNDVAFLVAIARRLLTEAGERQDPES